MSFHIGDLVQLKNGGPCMIIIGSQPNGYLLCCWFDGYDLREMTAHHDVLLCCEVPDESEKMLQTLFDFPKNK